MFYSKKEKEKNERIIAELKHEVKELTEIVKTQELLKLRSENARLKEKETLIEKVKFLLKDAYYLDEEGAFIIKYDVPAQKVFIDGEGNIQKNEFFYAINKLQLLTLKDLNKIQNLINDVKKNKLNV